LIKSDYIYSFLPDQNLPIIKNLMLFTKKTLFKDINNLISKFHKISVVKSLFQIRKKKFLLIFLKKMNPLLNFFKKNKNLIFKPSKNKWEKCHSDLFQKNLNLNEYFSISFIILIFNLFIFFICQKLIINIFLLIYLFQNPALLL
jgi:hypothetical protein